MNLNVGGGIFGSPLQAASRYCDSKIVKKLLNYGADPNIMGGEYGSCIGAVLHPPFNRQFFKDNLLCLELLLANGASVTSRTKSGEQALHIAARYCRHAEIFEVLLRYGAGVNATFNSHDEGLETITTPLGILCNLPMREEAMQVLLRAGADPNCYTPNGQSVLQSACDILGSSKMASALISKNVKIEARSQRDGSTALHSAAAASRSDIVLVLIEKGASVNARDEWKKTALHHACSTARINRDFDLRTTIEHLVISGQADHKAKDEDGATPLHYAARACNLTSVKALISLLSNDIIFERDSKGKLPLHWAAEVGFTDGLSYLVDSQSRLEAAPDKAGNTALHYAAENGHEKFVMNLLQGKLHVDINARDRAGYTALDLARKNDQIWIVAHLKDAVRIK